MHSVNRWHMHVKRGDLHIHQIEHEATAAQLHAKASCILSVLKCRGGSTFPRAYSASPAMPPCSIWIKLRFTSGTLTRLMRLHDETHKAASWCRHMVGQGLGPPRSTPNQAPQ